MAEFMSPKVEIASIGQLRWRCRRGMKELDVLLTRFLERDYPTASAQEQQQFAQLLELQDPLLWQYLSGSEQVKPPDAAVAELVRKIAAPD